MHGEGIVYAAFIAALLKLIAIGAFAVAARAIWLFLKRRRNTALAWGFPAFAYLVFFLWLSVPPTIPKKDVRIDFNHPDDLSGIPADVGWFPGELETGRSCAVEGAVRTRVVLPSDLSIEGETQAVFVDLDADGSIYHVLMTFPQVAAAEAYGRHASLFQELLQRDEHRSKVETRLREIEQALATYDPQRYWDGIAIFKIPNFEVSVEIKPMLGSEVIFHISIDRVVAREEILKRILKRNR